MKQIPRESKLRPTLNVADVRSLPCRIQLLGRPDPYLAGPQSLRFY